MFSRFATGITVLTASGTYPLGMTADSFTSVSLTPPLALICVKQTARIHEASLAEQAFAVSVLGSHQEQVARYFANHHRPRGEDEFALVDASPGTWTGAPIVKGALAWLECRLTAVYEGGDHSIFLGSVLGGGQSTDPDALLFCGGGFDRLQQEVQDA